MLRLSLCPCVVVFNSVFRMSGEKQTVVDGAYFSVYILVLQARCLTRCSTTTSTGPVQLQEQPAAVQHWGVSGNQ